MVFKGPLDYEVLFAAFRVSGGAIASDYSIP